MVNLEYICTDCEWMSASTEAATSSTKQAIDHHILCGHHVKRDGEIVTLRARGSKFQ